MFVRAGDREGGRHIEGSDSPLLALSTSLSGERIDDTAFETQRGTQSAKDPKNISGLHMHRPSCDM